MIDLGEGKKLIEVEENEVKIKGKKKHSNQM